MNEDESGTSQRSLTRRDFIAGSAAATALMATGSYAFAAADDKIRVGLVGCGGRGTQAAEQSVQSSPNVELVALGDLFKERVDAARNNLKSVGDRLKVTDDACFTGFDAYKKV